MTREPRLAREVLGRWDRLRVDRALQASGISNDPRLEVAESMAERVLRGVEDLVRELEAEREVERLLSDAERG